MITLMKSAAGAEAVNDLAGLIGFQTSLDGLHCTSPYDVLSLLYRLPLKSKGFTPIFQGKSIASIRPVSIDNIILLDL